MPGLVPEGAKCGNNKVGIRHFAYNYVAYKCFDY